MSSLSICICHYDNEQRNHNLITIWNKLNFQIRDNNLKENVEILIETDTGQSYVGEKRNRLLNKCSKEYVCFIDDDDDISDNYLKDIFDNLENNDILFLRINHIVNGEYKKTIVPSLHIENEIGEYYFVKNHFHLCPHKLSLAKEIYFPLSSFAEDLEYSINLSKKIYLHKYLENPIYIYLDNINTSLTRI
jgi:hypothetical protein